MGGKTIESSDMHSYYETHSHISSATTHQQVFRSSSMPKEFDPSQIKLPREACDSAETPHSRGIIYAEDVTGSMGQFLLSLIKDDFPNLIKQTYSAVSYDPHIMFMGVGDVEYDDAPLQVTQFEADLRMLDQLQRIYVERGGGGNDYESYALPWYFAGKHIEMDCYNKRGEKGFLFTFGDEYPTPNLSKRSIKKVFGNNDTLQANIISGQACLDMACKKFFCYHIILHGSAYDSATYSKWNKMDGLHVCDLRDHTCLADLVTTILKMYEGKSKTEAINEISGSHSRSIVTEALKDHEETVNSISVSDQPDAVIETF